VGKERYSGMLLAQWLDAAFSCGVSRSLLKGDIWRTCWEWVESITSWWLCLPWFALRVAANHRLNNWV